MSTLRGMLFFIHIATMRIARAEWLHGNRASSQPRAARFHAGKTAGTRAVGPGATAPEFAIAPASASIRFQAELAGDGCMTHLLVPLLAATWPGGTRGVLRDRARVSVGPRLGYSEARFRSDFNRRETD